MTPTEIGLTVFAIVLLAIIVWMFVSSRKRMKPQPKVYGLHEAEGFLNKVPEATPNDVKIADIFAHVLGYTNTVGVDADAVVSAIKEINRLRNEQIKGAEAAIAKLQYDIAGKKGEIAANDGRAARVIEVSKLFKR